MARKKQAEEKADTGGWINTFADLMNLLLCFFVLLFSMSTVDADKYEQLVTSMTESINIFDKGGDAISDGAFVSSGTDQLVSISEYFNEFENTGENVDSSITNDPSQSGQNNTSQTSLEDAKQAIEKDQKQRTQELYGEVMDEARNKNVEDQIQVKQDKNFQYVQISLNGAILFDSGEADIKKSALPLLSRVGDILQKYDAHMIKIEGHTDNVPISGGQYKNNMWLSTARATNVFDYLVSKKGLTPKTLEATGRSKYDPVGDNDTKTGRAQNRRVELKIYTDK
ncbi:MAG: flagellar motor protein MotB [Lachnospiraceae bacterium]|nr:flagellar motor protein MotB [Lachnospiraceae bacterium]